MREVNLFNIVIGQVIITTVAILCVDVQKKLKNDDDSCLIYEVVVFIILALYTLFNIICLICFVLQG